MFCQHICAYLFYEINELKKKNPQYMYFNANVKVPSQFFFQFFRLLYELHKRQRHFIERVSIYIL